MPELRDKADVDKDIRRFLPHTLADNVVMMDFSYEDSEYKTLIGKSFQTLIIPDDPENLPFMPIAETSGLRRTVIYIRRLASSEEANYDEVQILLNRKISTGHSTQNILDLDKHLRDLGVLYSELERFYILHPGGSIFADCSGFIEGEFCPRKSYEEFVNDMIDEKQRQIQQLLE